MIKINDLAKGTTIDQSNDCANLSIYSQFFPNKNTKIYYFIST